MSTARRLVAVTAAVEPKQGRADHPEAALEAGYIRLLERVDITPLIITPAHSEASIDALVERADGLLLSGGEDIAPDRYGQAAVPQLGAVDPNRDAMEWLALERALAREVPVLGICRGVQLLNVYFGGTLWQDLSSQKPGALRHEQPGEWTETGHAVSLEPDSRLRRLCGADRFPVNSFHHQAVDTPGRGLRVAARADDGVVEALEAEDERAWIMGVQWHPERYGVEPPDSDPGVRLLSAFRDVLGTR